MELLNPSYLVYYIYLFNEKGGDVHVACISLQHSLIAQATTYICAFLFWQGLSDENEGGVKLLTNEHSDKLLPYFLSHIFLALTIQ